MVVISFEIISVEQHSVTPVPLNGSKLVEVCEARMCVTLLLLVITKDDVLFMLVLLCMIQ